MPEAARITSVEAVEAFRADLLVYLEKARNVVDEVGEEVTRTRAWLQDDRGPHWAQQVKRRTIALQERQQELFSAQLGNFKHNIQGELVAVRRAKQAVEEAEEKVKAVKRWLRDYPIEVEPLARHADLLRHSLVSDMGKAVVLLSQIIETLDAYAAVKPPTVEAAPPAPTPETPPSA
jgi:vacuolar-type H+-ATPase subunit I/STV1